MANDQTYQFIRLEIDNNVAWLTLARADKHNAFNEHVISEITDALKRVQDIDNIRALVLQAEGKSFSAGADLDWMKRMAAYDFEQNVEDANGLATMLNTLYRLPIPTIAKVQGSAFGGGIGLVACCDIALASSTAKFCLSEVKLGLIPATISPYVIAAVGEKIARRLFISAEVFNPSQALQWNLLTEVTAPEELDGAVTRWLEVFAANSTAAMIAAKQLAHDVAGQSIDPTLLDHTSRAIASARTSPQGREGVAAFLEKRKPSWE